MNPTETTRINGISQVAGVPNADGTTNSTPTTAAPVITPSALFPVAPVNVPNQTPSTTIPDLMGSIDSQARTYAQTVVDQKRIDEERAKATNYDTELKGLFDTLGTKGVATEQAYKDEGVDTARTALTDVNNSILAEQNALNHQKDAIFNESGVTREQAQQKFSEVQRISLGKQADMSVIQYAAQNRYSDAKAIADRKIEMQFEPLQVKLDALKYFAEKNDAHLSDDQKTQLQAIISERSRLLTDQKEAAKILQDTKLQAIKDAQESGAPISVLSAIQNATTPESVLSAQGKYQGLDAKLKQAQISNIYSEINSRNNPAVEDPSQIIAYAQQYASTGTIPTGLPKGTFGMVSQYAKELPKPNGTLVDRNTGVKSGKFNATEEQSVNALFDLTQRINDLKTSYSKLAGGGPIQGQDFKDKVSEINELLLRARTGAQANDEELKAAGKKLPTGSAIDFGLLGKDSALRKVAEKKIEDFQYSMEQKLNTILKSNGLSIYGYSTVDLGGQPHVVGSTITDGKQVGRVNPDGSITLISQ